MIKLIDTLSSIFWIVLLVSSAGFILITAYERLVDFVEWLRKR